MTRAKGILTGGRALTKWIQRNPTEGTLLQRIITGVNTLADNTASSAVGRLSPPPPINALSVKVSGEYAHVTLAHSGDIQQGVHYFVEVANNEVSAVLIRSTLELAEPATRFILRRTMTQGIRRSGICEPMRNIRARTHLSL